VSRQNTNSEFEGITDDDPTNIVYADKSLMAILVEAEEGVAIGYTTFDLKWEAHATVTAPSDIALEVFVEEVWLVPKYRGQGLSTMLAECVATATSESLEFVNKMVSWGQHPGARMVLNVAADVCSESGEGFLRSCMNALLNTEEHRRVREPDAKLHVVERAYEARW
jgi:GNAT superfamily N-acetyltransferase